MAKLEIHTDIITQDEKDEVRIWFGDALNYGITFTDINDFVKSIPESDNKIELFIKCRGGSVSEGWAMYDALRATGKEISATIEGECASMATILLLAAPKERRYAREHAQLLIHNPYIGGAYGELNADRLQQISEELRAEQERILDLYVERTGSDREELQAIMNKGEFFNADEALRLGFISTIIQPASARARKATTYNQHLTTKKQNKKEMKKNILERLKAFFNDIADDLDMKAMELNTADGGVLTIEREEGEPQVGDAASPDGEHAMPDGSVIVVVDGVITEIRAAEQGAEGEGGEEMTPEDVQKLKDENEALKAENESLKAEVERLKGELESANAKAKSAEDMRVLNAVKMAGGIDKLAKGISSNGVETPRKPEGANASAHAGEISAAAELLARRSSK